MSASGDNGLLLGLGLVVCLVGSAYFSGTETGLMSISRCLLYTSPSPRD